MTEGKFHVGKKDKVPSKISSSLYYDSLDDLFHDRNRKFSDSETGFRIKAEDLKGVDDTDTFEMGINMLGFIRYSPWMGDEKINGTYCPKPSSLEEEELPYATPY